MIGVAFEWILKGKPTAADRIAAEGTLGVDAAAGPMAVAVRRKAPPHSQWYRARMTEATVPTAYCSFH